MTSRSQISLQKPIDCCRSQKIPLVANFQLISSSSLSINSGQTHIDLQSLMYRFTIIDLRID